MMIGGGITIALGLTETHSEKVSDEFVCGPILTSGLLPLALPRLKGRNVAHPNHWRDGTRLG